jgi:hypothetical protein
MEKIEDKVLACFFETLFKELVIAFRNLPVTVNFAP